MREKEREWLFAKAHWTNNGNPNGILGCDNKASHLNNIKITIIITTIVMLCVYTMCKWECESLGEQITHGIANCHSNKEESEREKIKGVREREWT